MAAGISPWAARNSSFKSVEASSTGPLTKNEFVQLNVEPQLNELVRALDTMSTMKGEGRMFENSPNGHGRDVTVECYSKVRNARLHGKVLVAEGVPHQTTPNAKSDAVDAVDAESEAQTRGLSPGS